MALGDGASISAGNGTITVHAETDSRSHGQTTGTAGGAVAKEFLRALGVEVFSHVLQITSVSAPRRDDLTPEDFAKVDDSPVRCLDAEATRAMVNEINTLRKQNE